MAKKQITSETVLSAYMNHILEHGTRPKNVFVFAKELKISEQEFYQHYASFDVLEQEVFTTFFTNTLEFIAQKTRTIQHLIQKIKLLSFYFTLLRK